MIEISPYIQTEGLQMGSVSHEMRIAFKYDISSRGLLHSVSIAHTSISFSALKQVFPHV